MNAMGDFFGRYFTPALFLIAVAAAVTVYVFRRRLFDRGYRKGTAKDPQQVRAQNPPDNRR